MPIDGECARRGKTGSRVCRSQRDSFDVKIEGGRDTVKFMIIRKADRNTEAGIMPRTELITAMLKYNEEMAKAGVLLDGVGLHPSSKGVRVTRTAGQRTVTDGPFTETKELIAGFSMIQARSDPKSVV